MRLMKGIGLGLTCTLRDFLRLLKGIGLGLTCTSKGVYEGIERDRVRVKMHT